jgi:hypothetical protein
MATDRNNDYLLTHYLSLTDERTTNLPLVPFILGNRDSPLVLRGPVWEAIVAALNWNVREVSASTSVAADDVIISVDTVSASGNVTITLSAQAEERVLIFKDATGSASDNNIIIDVAASDSGVTIDGRDEVHIAADYGVVVIFAGGSNWHMLVAA